VSPAFIRGGRSRKWFAVSPWCESAHLREAQGFSTGDYSNAPETEAEAVARWNTWVTNRSATVAAPVAPV
jgi:hypothetical protein